MHSSSGVKPLALRSPIPDPRLVRRSFSEGGSPIPALHGFSLIEVVVAMSLLATALASVAQLLAVASRANATARDVTLASVLAQQKLEQLRALAWGFDSTELRLSDLTTDLSVDPPNLGGGVGLGASPADTLSENVTGFVDYLNASGAWIGTGAMPPSGTVYVRRWSVEPLANSPTDTLILEVVVAHARRKKSAGASASAWVANDAHLVAVKTRKRL